MGVIVGRGRVDAYGGVRWVGCLCREKRILGSIRMSVHVPFGTKVSGNWNASRGIVM